MTQAEKGRAYFEGFKAQRKAKPPGEKVHYYALMNVRIFKEKRDAFAAKCKANGITMAAFMETVIDDYLGAGDE